MFCFAISNQRQSSDMGMSNTEVLPIHNYQHPRRMTSKRSTGECGLAVQAGTVTINLPFNTLVLLTRFWRTVHQTWSQYRLNTPESSTLHTHARGITICLILLGCNFMTRKFLTSGKVAPLIECLPSMPGPGGEELQVIDYSKQLCLHRNPPAFLNSRQKSTTN